MSIDYGKVINLAEKYQDDMFKFLRDIIEIRSESCREQQVIARIKEEMIKINFDQITIDKMGNIIGVLGTGETVLAMDAHIDTVGVGDETQWQFDPFKGFEDEETIGGRGASDQKGGMASMIYACKIIKDLNLIDDYKLIITGTIQEEDCDGLCWNHLIENEKIIPEVVILTEPTECNIYRGQRGRMEIRVTTKGVSCHGSAPERGENAIYKMGRVIQEIEELNSKLGYDDFLGKGSIVLSEIESLAPSRCAVPDKCIISLDRRLTFGESKKSALLEIESLESVKRSNAKVDLYRYDKPSYKDLIIDTECYFPAWKVEEEHPLVKSLVESIESLYDYSPLIDKWTFSTNGVSIMGKHGIPCVGIGPGKENEAHKANEKTWKEHLVKCAAIYAVFPINYLNQKFQGDFYEI